MSENTQTQEQQTQQPVYDRFEGPFDAVAYLLMIARLSMENPNAEGELPRYARIVRANEVIGSDQIPDWLEAPAKWARSGTEGMNFFVSRLITLTLQAKDVLKGTDALIALAEIALEMIEVATSGDFWTAIGNSVDPNGQGAVAIPSSTVMDGFNGPGNESFNLDKVKDWLKYIPNPEDLNRIGHELYRMSCLGYKNNNTIDIESTGKLRLLQYTFGQDWDVYLQNAYVPTTKLGQEKTETFNGSTIEYQPEGGGQKIELFTTPASPASQENEIDNVLTALEYDKDDPLSNNIRQFQKENDLPTEGVINGAINEETINRFFNLDSENKNLVWARKKQGSFEDSEKYTTGYLNLVNGDADDYTGEGLTPLSQNQSKYRYYEIRTENNFPPDGKGWVRKAPGTEGGVTYINGFVAIESRFMNVSRKDNGPIYEGDQISEGEAASGRFFFAARHTQPWIPGRSGTPDPSIYSDVQPQPGHISRMHQDVVETIPDLISKAPSGELINDYNIAFEASCLRRSLYIERGGEKKILGQPDQGRILLEVYHGDNTTPAWSDPYIAAKNGWQPGPQVTKAFVSDARINQRNNWFKQTSDLYVIDVASLINEDTTNVIFADASAFTGQNLRFRVILEGKHQANWDTDAYFDDVRLKWMFVPKPV